MRDGIDPRAAWLPLPSCPAACIIIHIGDRRKEPAMIGRFGDQVTHLPTGKKGKVVMHPSGSIGVFSTAVDLGNGRIEEFPDSELMVSQDGGGMVLKGIRFASNRPTPGKTKIEIYNNGDGT